MARIAQSVFVALVLLVTASAMAEAATINAQSCSFAAVTSAINAAADGDTVVLPSCPGGVSWTSTLAIAKGITLQGQGIANTILIDDVFKGGAGCSGGAAPMVRITVNSPNTFRVSGMTIRGNAPDPNRCQVGHFSISGTSKAFRIDNVRFENMQTVGIRTGGDLWGVIDHCEFQGVGKNGIIFIHGNWNGASFGDGSWATPSNFGSQEFIFVEDCDFSGITNQNGVGAMDSFDGARFVIRYNKGINQIITHGTDSGGRRRSTRAYEIYNNTFAPELNFEFTAVSLRGGTGVIHSNNFDNNGTLKYSTIVLAQNFRDRDTFAGFGTCTGTSTFDINDGIVYVSGTHNGPDGVSNTLTDTTKNFTTACSGGNCLGGFSILNITKGWSSTIASITNTTVTNLNSTFSQGRIWDAGDSYEIRKVYPCIDQVGRGQGDLLSGNPPTPTGWPNQAVEPLYQWNNTKGGIGSPSMSSNSPHIQANRDFFDNVVKPGYTPFQYPHPLTLTSGGPVAAPTNLRKVSP